MTSVGRLTSIPIWDGRTAIGACDLEWIVDADDGRITRVERIDAGLGDPGYAVIPGLIDTHVHLIGHAGHGCADFMSWPLTTRPEERVLHGLAHARRALSAGVTTLRDMSADEIQFSLAKALNSGLVEGPRLLAHGMVSMTAGHGDLFTPPAVADRPRTADGVDECRRLVRHWARAGADGIKIATSGGVLSIGDRVSWRNHTSNEIDAIIDEAHALSMPVAAHAHTETGISIALEAGVDSIEHATLVERDQAELMAKRGVTAAPTLLINDRIAAGERGVTAAQAEKAADLVHRRDERMRVAADVGVDFVLGTDANGHHVDFGDELIELRSMAGVFGWSAERTLQAATSRAAAAIGRTGVLGEISVGAAADFVVLRGEPWQDLALLDVDNIVAVVSRGRVVAGSLPG